MRLIVGKKLASDAVAEFFEFFRELACDAELSIRDDAGTCGKCFGQAIRRFKEDRGFATLSRCA